MKKLLLFSLTIVLLKPIYSQNFLKPSQKDELISTFMQFSQKQLFDTANYYFSQNSFDTASICYNLIINAPVSTDPEQHLRVIKALRTTGHIYYNVCDYRNAYKYHIDALLLSEKYNMVSEQAKIYNNLGNIYGRFNKFESAKSYYFKVLYLSTDSTIFGVLYNNIGQVELENGNMDSAFYYLNKSLQISEKYNRKYLFGVYNTVASIYQKTKQYDSALYYFRLSLDESKKSNQVEQEVQTLSDLSKLFFEIKKTDSALFYIDLSNTLATENNILRILSENYLMLSKIEESKGSIKNAFNHYKTYTRLRDSVFNSDIFGDINQLQRLYEISKTNQQIEQLVVEQQIKERTIYYQKIIWFITLCVLVLLSIGLLYIYIQKKNLGKAYKVLFEKNREIIELQGDSSKINRKKQKKSALMQHLQHELLNRIITLMEDVSIICDTEFSIDKLAELVHSNQNYVSQVINSALKQNFRSLLNSYRIQEAQRLFLKPETAKYTIESIALRVGFKSPNAFRYAFKDITGITPNLYLQLMREENRTI